MKRLLIYSHYVSKIERKMLDFVLRRIAAVQANKLCASMVENAHKLARDWFFSDAMTQLNQAIEISYAPAFAEMAWWYTWGINSVSRNVHMAYALAVKGAALGNINSIAILAYCKLKGIGCYKNLVDATSLADVSIKAGNSIGFYVTGLLYELGTNGPPNEKKAQKYIEIAANMGLEVAQNHLAVMYEFRFFNKKMSESDRNKKAVELYTLAADKNLPFAVYNLGRCYEYEKGVDKDIRKAILLYRRAEHLECIEACGNASRLEMRLRKSRKRARIEQYEQKKAQAKNT
jgi:hypothetical protein